MSSRHDLQKQAASWIRRLDEKDTPQDARAAFIHWCKQSPRHVRAMLELGRLRQELRRLNTDEHDVDTDALGHTLLNNARTAASNWTPGDVSDINETNGTSRDSQHTACNPSRSMLRRCLQIAAATALMMTLGITSHIALHSGQQEISTSAGESRRVILRDNTYVRLGPNTRMVTHFTRHQRLIEFSTGEALFHVTQDPSRPFLVRTDVMTARAIGTVFAVSHYADDTTPTTSVTVARGKVDVQTTDVSTTPVRIEDNERALVQPDTQTRVSRIDPRDELAWVDNRLVFYQGATLASAAQQFNRRNQLQILITDTALAARPVMGTFRASDPQAFLNHFAPRVPFTIKVESPDQVHLVPL